MSLRLMAALAGLVVVVMLAAVTLGQRKEIHALTLDRDMYKLQAGQNALNLQIKTLEAADLRMQHEACMGEIKISLDKQADAKHALELLEDQAKRSAVNARAAREAIYHLPKCEDFVSMDIALMCPELANSMRRAAAELSAAR